MDGIAENGNSVAGHSHFQAAAASTTTTTTAAAAIINGTTAQPMMSASLPVSVTINSVSPDAATQPPSDAHEVGSPQPSMRKTLETANDNKFKSATNQFHSRHGSEHNTTINADQQQSFSLVSDRKQQLEHLTIGKCTSTPAAAATAPANTKPAATSHLNQSLESAKQNPVVKKFLQSSDKRNSAPNWFPSKRNSLILLADQQRFESKAEKKKRCSEPTGNSGDKMVAMQELATAATFDDNSEELAYGPGIVSKLRCRYLSLALRQTVKQRPTLDNLRRANSMSNLLEEENVDIDEVDDRNNGHHGMIDDNEQQNSCQFNDNKLNGSHEKSIIQVEYTTNYINCSNGTSDTLINPDSMKTSNKGMDSRRQVQRGNDSLKRARSVEALMRYDTLAWRRDVLEDSEDYPSSNPIILDEIIVSDYQSTVIKAKTADSITIEDKIQQARDRMNDPKPPRRLTSFMSETERPPPDLVKQTLLKFEASANKRNRAIQRYGNGDVAAKVATYKSKMSHDKSPLTSPQITSKLPPSGFGGKKPLIKPRTTSPKPPPPPTFLNGTSATKEPTKKIYTKTIEHDIDTSHTAFNGNGLKSSDVERMNQKNSAANFTNRLDTSTYRSKIASPDSPPATSPSCESPRSSYVYDMVRRRENNHADSPLITQLARKTESLVLATPKSRKTSTSADIAFGTDDSSVQPSDNDDYCDDATSNSSETGWSESYDVNIISDNEDNSSEIDMDFLAKKPPMPKSKLNGNQIKATVISVQPAINCISNGSMDKKSEQPEPSVRQIGIIRPLNHEIPLQPPIARPPPIPIARNRLPSPSSPKKEVTDNAIKVSVAAAPIVVSTQHSVVLPSSTSSVVVTNSVSVATSNDVQGDVVVIECSGDSNIDTKTMSPISTPPTANSNNRTKLINNTEPTNTISIDTRSIVHQKNLLNKEKSEEVLNGSSPQGLIQSPIKWNIKKSTVVSSSPVSNVAVNQSSSPTNQQATATAAATAAAKQRPSDIQTTNTMVFNFSNRKDVPDYIENDGLVIRRKRELPKPGESGFVLLGDLTVETSTDPEPDDSWICDPPSPCDVQFKNANVVINGKSSLRDRSRGDPKQMSIRFNDVLTSTFEYPSESSLCEEIGLSNGDSFDDDDSDLLYSNGHFLGSSPIASVPLGNYQPIKIFNTNFELGVTRTNTSSPNQNTSHKYQAPPPPPPRTHSNGKVPKPVSSPTAVSPPDHHQQLISIDSSTTATSNGGDPESLQYLKPANEDAVAWSEGASDLLF
ncbi:uncharacterized protein LOC129570613 isoform X2 [Sitodiplosis mosellana]|nr:uncharacterized protein LOC129570613 isoform X2 [Sitodiplosis mosellana]